MTPSEFTVLTTSATPAALEEFDELLAETWSRNSHVPEGIRVQMGIAVAEIAANIIEHASKAGPVSISMEVRALADEVRVEFVDDGSPFDSDLSMVSLPDDMAERGRGLALAKAVLSKLSYRRDTANHWTLVSKSFSA